MPLFSIFMDKKLHYRWQEMEDYQPSHFVHGLLWLRHITLYWPAHKILELIASQSKIDSCADSPEPLQVTYTKYGCR